MPSETEALLPSNASGSGPSYYFLHQEGNEAGTNSSVRDADGGEVVDTLPEGAEPQEFAARPVNTPRAVRFHIP